MTDYSMRTTQDVAAMERELTTLREECRRLIRTNDALINQRDALEDRVATLQSERDAEMTRANRLMTICESTSIHLVHGLRQMDDERRAKLRAERQPQPEVAPEPPAAPEEDDGEAPPAFLREPPPEMVQVTIPRMKLSDHVMELIKRPGVGGFVSASPAAEALRAHRMAEERQTSAAAATATQPEPIYRGSIPLGPNPKTAQEQADAEKYYADIDSRLRESAELVNRESGMPPRGIVRMDIQDPRLPDLNLVEPPPEPGSLEGMIADVVRGKRHG